MIFYDLGIFAWALISLPKLFSKKYHGTILERLFGPRGKRIEKEVVWFHAVSLGESNAALPLVKRYRKENPATYILFSCTTKTAAENIAKKMPEVDRQIYLPLDFKWTMRRLMKMFHPKEVIVLESEFWYNFLSEAKKSGAKVVLANGKMSDRSFKRFFKLRALSKHLFNKFDLLLMQGQNYADKLLQFGLEPHVVGNLKFDVEKQPLADREIASLKEEIGLKEEKVVLIASSHADEEKLLTEALKTFEGRIMIAPRHPERFDTVYRELLPDVEYYGEKKGKRIILVNKMGMMDLCYQLADVVIMAGSFTGKVGGHNILEPIEFQKLTLFGPYMYSQKELCDQVLAYRAGLQVTPDEIAPTIARYLSTDLEQEMKSHALTLLEKTKGATERTYSHLAALT